MRAMPLRPDDKFDRYVIGALLGKGGMGEVYRAHDTRLQRAVALKILRGDDQALGADGRLTTDGAARLLREARAAAAMDHPNAVSIFDVGECDGTPFLAMEFIAGKTLRAYVGDPALPMERRLRWLMDVARALGSAHKRGLVHRDVKPENVMVREDGVIKVLDFGIARRSSLPVDPTAPTEAVALETLTAKGVVVGTPVYMAPEQMRGEALDGRADQFAWGVVAYELLTGALPWTSQGSALQIVSQILSKDPEPPRERNAAIPEEVEAVVLQAMAKAPQDRFAAMESIAALLEPFAGASGQLAAPVPSARPPLRSSPSGRTQLTTTGTPGTLRAAPKPSRRRWIAVGAGALAIAGLAAVIAARRAKDVTVTQGTHGSAVAPAPVLAWTDSGSVMSTNVEALGAYRAGMQGVRDATMDRARSDLERAATLDPTFAAAHLRAALAAEVLDTPTHTHIQKAIQLRQSLSEHDRAILDAIEPWTRVPPDLKESERRLVAAVAKTPGDADFLYLLGTVRHKMWDYRRALTAFDDALKVDPSIASAYRFKAREQLRLDDAVNARKTYDACLAVSHAATWCVDDLNDLSSNEGSCEEAEQLSRQLIALDPHSARGFARLAAAVYGIHKPIEGARGALEQEWQRTPAPQRKTEELSGAYRLAVLVGDFNAASERLNAWERESAASPDEWDHTLPFRYQMLLAIEMGKGSEAARLADEYVKRRAAWTPDDFREEPTIYALQTMYRTGSIPRDVMQAERAAWLAREADRLGRVGERSNGGGMAWYLGYAEMVVTPDDARDALAVLPAFLPLPDALARGTPIDDAIGMTYVRAGDLNAALPFLTRAARTCGAIDQPIAHTWANAHLAAALEEKGDKAAACAAYKVVLDRWKNAKPRSETAEVARARARALGCPG
jgi:serine/threonine-protein kinase